MSPGGRWVPWTRHGSPREPSRADSGFILEASRPQNPCSRAGGSSIFKKTYFSALNSKKVSRSVLGAPRNVPRSARRRPQNFPVEGPGAARGSQGGRLASRTSPQGLRQAWRLLRLRIGALSGALPVSTDACTENVGDLPTTTSRAFRMTTARRKGGKPHRRVKTQEGGR